MIFEYIHNLIDEIEEEDLEQVSHVIDVLDSVQTPENSVKNSMIEWGQLDLNQRSRETRGLQPLAIATMRCPLKI